jgi:AcrR family transcriptional regulator
VSGGDGREAVAALRRGRVLEAMAEVVAERGLRGASVAAVTRRASVSPAIFNELFGSVEECFLVLVNSMLERATVSIEEVFERESSWQDGVAAGLQAMVAFLDAEPVCARACLLESVAGSPQALAPLVELLGRLTNLVDRARESLSRERQPSALTAEATVGSVFGILRRRLIEGRAPPFAPLLGQLVELVVAQYLGPSAAALAASGAQERASAISRERSTRSPVARVEIPDMLCHASARRLRSVLLCVLESPGSSNEDVAAELDIYHTGQVSTVLARLHDAGLLVKERDGRSNAWSLSPYGVEVAWALDGR